MTRSPGPPSPSLRSRVAPFIAMDVMTAARKLEDGGAHIIHMEVGEPAAPAPRPAREAAMRALEAGRIGYTEALGRPSLRARIARAYRERYGVEVPAERVVVTTGSSAGFILAFLAMFDPGARIAIAAPGYPAYRNILEALGLEAVALPTQAADRHVVTAAMIEAAHAQTPLAGALLMSPANPTGTMMSPSALRAICETCDRLSIAFVSDEIYHGLHYGDRAVSALEISDEAYVINSFSKYFSMTGWRLGWMVVPEDHIRTVERLAQNMFICPPHVSQVAALAALDCIDELEANRAVYAANRRLMLDGLPKAGFTRIAPPDGAFYIYADVSGLTDNSLQLARDILHGAGVAVTPGLDFDPVRGYRPCGFPMRAPRPTLPKGWSGCVSS